MQIQFCNYDYYRYTFELERKRNEEIASHKLPNLYFKNTEKNILQCIYKGGMIQMNSTQTIKPIPISKIHVIIINRFLL